MDEVIKEVLLKELLVDLAKYDQDALFENTREEHLEHLEGMNDAEIEGLLENLNIMDEKFEEGGRWSNYRSRIYRGYLSGGEGFVYIEVTDEVPATEMQEGGAFMDLEINRVYPHKVTTTVYKGEPQGE